MKLKLKLPSLPRLPKLPKMPRMLPKKKLAANTRRMARDSDELEEPNMKLSSAFIVVLALHVVAVGGIYAFNSIKSHRAPSVDPTYRPASARPTTAGQADDDASPVAVPAAMTTAAAVPVPRVHRVKSGETLARIASDAGVSVEDLEEANGMKSAGPLHAGQELKIPAASTVAHPTDKKSGTTTSKAPGMVRDTGDSYTVVKGDNPVAIARKFGVSYDELLKLNKIEDPRKMRIGTKLHLPPKTKHP